MRDAKSDNERRRPKSRELEDALERSMPSYSPEHRRAVLKGLRILARVAIRSYIEERAGFQPEDDGEGKSPCGA